MFATVNNNNKSYVTALLIISIMEVEFDTRFKHPWSMIVSGPSSSGKTVFTKQVLNKSDKQFAKIYWFYSEWQGRIQRLPWNQLCVGHAIIAGRIPRIKWAQSHVCLTI